MLADIGGLNDILIYIGGQLIYIITCILGNGVNRFLIYNIFRTDGPNQERTEYSKKSRNGMIQHIRKRVPLRVRICKWLMPCSKDTDQLQAKAEDLILKELDLVRFIKRQKMYEIALKVLFSKTERFLIRN